MNDSGACVNWRVISLNGHGHMAERKGLTQNEEDAATLYLHCFVKILNWDGIKIPSNLFSGDEKILRFLSEKFQ